MQRIAIYEASFTFEWIERSAFRITGAFIGCFVND